jgi:lipopolysaccharide transport system permease protein
MANTDPMTAQQDKATLLETKPLPKIVIEPSKGWVPVKISELIEYRDLFYFFTWRDLKVRYKQTILGVFWAILQPFITMVIFSLFFGRLANMPSDGLPYPIFSYAALVPWTFFANGVTQASNSLVQNSNMIKKIYFPRLIMPTSAVLGGLIDFALAFLVLLGMMLFYHIYPTINVIWLPLFMLLAIITAIGVSLWFSAMNVLFRDVRYIVPFLMQVWLFLTPIAYPSSLVPEKYQPLYGLNPMAGVVEGFRWALLGTDTFPGPLLLVSFLVAVIFLVTGVYYFRRMEKSFADVI